MAPLHSVAIALSCLSVVPVYAASNPVDSLVASLSPGSEVYFPNNATWADITGRWTVWDDPDFTSAIIPATEKDVVEIVKTASKYKIPFLATRSRHGYSGTLQSLKRGIHVDLRKFDKVNVDAKANRMTIGGGVLFEAIIPPLYKAGKELQTGACPCVSVLGPTLGGGLSRYEGIHGLITDALVSARVVTGVGNIVTASRTQNSDLFWGLQGAGFNFGVVVEATYEIYDLTNGGNVVNADYVFPAPANRSFYQAMKDVSATMPAELSLLSLLFYDPNTQSTSMLLNAVYAGPLSKAKELLKPFIDIGAVQQNVSETTWNTMPYLAGFGAQGTLCEKRTLRSLFSAGLKYVDVDNMVSIFNKYADFHKKVPGARKSTYELAIYAPQAVQKIPDDATAYPHRDIGIHALPSCQWEDRSLDVQIDEFSTSIRDQTAAKSGFDKLRLYVNYAHGDEKPESLYGKKKLPKLRQLKRKFDPQGLFSHFNPF
ncbi:FAD-dependent oxidase [Massariosphaeria phaeospora]|uniref:FAD-dependent oxidase n=1 Tax=Massariosphaeria phaeospora TaxID=100035 RepID=A0A7C8I9C2_9PLEO|nr:FAD-dependent oxidase [Massariosphaeria phaeospora]